MASTNPKHPEQRLNMQGNPMKKPRKSEIRHLETQLSVQRASLSVKKTVKNNSKKNMFSACLAVFFAGAIATTVSLATIQSRTILGNNQMIAGRNGKVLGTALAEKELDILDLPKIGDAEVYKNIKQISLYCGSMLEGYVVTGYRWKNEKTMTFFTSRNTVITITAQGISSRTEGPSGDSSQTCSVNPPEEVTSATRRLGKAVAKKATATVIVSVNANAAKASGTDSEKVKIPVKEGTVTTTAAPWTDAMPESDEATRSCKDLGWTTQNDPFGFNCCQSHHSLTVAEGGLGPGCCYDPYVSASVFAENSDGTDASNGCLTDGSGVGCNTGTSYIGTESLSYQCHDNYFIASASIPYTQGRCNWYNSLCVFPPCARCSWFAP